MRLPREKEVATPAVSPHRLLLRRVQPGTPLPGCMTPLQTSSQEGLPLLEDGLGWEGWRGYLLSEGLIWVGVQSRREGTWINWLMQAGVSTDVLVVARGRLKERSPPPNAINAPLKQLKAITPVKRVDTLPIN